jgi:hypothetical protein
MKRTPDFMTCAIAGGTAVIWGMVLLFGDIFVLGAHFQ